MARKPKIDNDTLISLIDQFYAEKCDDDASQLKIPQIGKYVRSKGYEVADRLIRRNEIAKAYIKNLKDNTEEIHIHTVAVYKDMDMDVFLIKNNTKEKLKTALQERENYYRKVSNSAAYSFKEKTRLEQEVKDFRKQLVELEKELKNAVNNGADVISDNRKYKSENQQLRKIIETCVYPGVANQLLKQHGLLKNTDQMINPDTIKIVTAESDVTEIKSKVIKGLFDNI